VTAHLAGVVQPAAAPDELGLRLVEGGDERIALDPATGLNRYGCASAPNPGEAAFGSSTASTISAPAYFAAGDLAVRLTAYPTSREAYRAESERLRRRLAALCGLPPEAASRIILGASGTDLHLVAADLARGASLSPLMTVFADPCETGSGVPAAIRGLRFAATPPHGRSAQDVGAPVGEGLSVALREADGAPRDAQAVDDDFAAACERAMRSGGRVLLILVDVSKTGLIAPSPAQAVELKARFGDRLTVLVDACQFRISAESLAAYLARDFLVAVTGSKFLGGPAFSGALFLPQAAATGMAGHAPAPMLGDYLGREDWPAAFAGRNLLPDQPNLGLLLRWEAALHELSAFRCLDTAACAGFLRDFADAVEIGLDGHPDLERVETAPLRRFGGADWDTVPTIFPFVVTPRGGTLGAAQTAALHRSLYTKPGEGGTVRLGQPVVVGVRGGQPLSGLRLCASAAHVVEALRSPAAAEAVITRALDALDATAARAAAMMAG
jgi:hypothetical protein